LKVYTEYSFEFPIFESQEFKVAQTLQMNQLDGYKDGDTEY